MSIKQGQTSKTDVKAWALLLILTLIWGSSFILIKKGLVVFTAMEVGSLRIFSAGLVLIPFILTRTGSVNTKKEWFFIALSGLIGSLIPSLLFAFAETRVGSAVTGILNALTPLMTLVVGVLLFQKPMLKQQSVGLSIGLAGTILFMTMGKTDEISGFNAYGLLIILATMLYGLNLNLIKKHLGKVDAITISAFSLVLMLPLSGIPLFVDGTFVSKIQTHPDAFIALSYLLVLGIIGTAFALVLFNRLVQIKDPVFASSVTYLIPIIAIGWGIIDGESLHLFHYVGLIVIIYGVFLTNKKARSKI